MTRIAALLAVLAVGFALFYASAKTPAPASVNAPATSFSAGRAMRDIAVMGAVPHPVGSPANAAVRDYLVRRMGEMGLSPRVQSDDGVRAVGQGGDRWVYGAHVENVIGVLKGRDANLPALAIMAHHDSVPGSPGAADDITGVADALEIVHAIQASGQPRRDVMLVITDGEEVDLLGAEAFFADDPEAKHVGFVLNLEARGGGGRAQMFETGPGNAAAVNLFLKTAIRPAANSLSVFLYKQLPNDTDYTVAKAAGVPGLNIAFIGRQFDYHSPSSTVAALDQGAVQHMGDEALGPARALANAPALPAQTNDAVYANLVGDFVLAYPPWVGWIVLAIAGSLIVGSIIRARRGKELQWLDIAQGAGASILLLAGAALAMHLVRHLTGVDFGWIEGRALLARFPTYESTIALAGLAAAMFSLFALSIGEARLAALLFAATGALASSALGGLDATAIVEAGIVLILGLILLGRPAGYAGAWAGALAVAWLLSLALQCLAPTIAFLIAWPMTAGVAVAHLTAPTQKAPAWLRWVFALTVMALTAAWAGNLVHNLLEAMDLPELPALPVWLASLALWPLLWPRPGSRSASVVLASLALATSIAGALWLATTNPWTSRYPNITEPLFIVDEGSGRAWRVSPFSLDPWTRGVLVAAGGKVQRSNFPTFSAPAWAVPAAPASVPAPKIDVMRASDGTVTVHVSSEPNQRLRLDMKTDAIVTTGAAQGRSVPMLTRPDQWTHFLWAASNNLNISFKPLGHGSLDIRYAAFTPGWPPTAKPPPPVPPTLMPWNMAGASVATGSIRTNW